MDFAKADYYAIVEAVKRVEMPLHLYNPQLALGLRNPAIKSEIRNAIVMVEMKVAQERPRRKRRR